MSSILGLDEARTALGVLIRSLLLCVVLSCGTEVESSVSSDDTDSNDASDSGAEASDSNFDSTDAACQPVLTIDPEDAALTPRTDYSAELLALSCRDGDVVADEERYQRMSRDLAAIRELDPRVSWIEFHAAQFYGNSLNITVESEELVEEMLTGGYGDWSCLHAQLKGVEVTELSTSTKGVRVSYDAVYNTPILADVYRGFRGIEFVYVEQSQAFADSTIAATHEGETRYYRLRDCGGFCAAFRYYFYRVGATGDATLIHESCTEYNYEGFCDNPSPGPPIEPVDDIPTMTCFQGEFW